GGNKNRNVGATLADADAIRGMVCGGLCGPASPGSYARPAGIRVEMSTQTNAVLAPYVARARKVLQLEQRANHQDTVVKPGGLELFVLRWVEEPERVCKSAGLDLAPIHRFAEHLEGYRRQDPMQRASSLRAALAILDSLDGSGQHSKSTPPTPPTPA